MAPVSNARCLITRKRDQRHIKKVISSKVDMPLHSPRAAVRRFSVNFAAGFSSRRVENRNNELGRELKVEFFAIFWDFFIFVFMSFLRDFLKGFSGNWHWRAMENRNNELGRELKVTLFAYFKKNQLYMNRTRKRRVFREISQQGVYLFRGILR